MRQGSKAQRWIISTILACFVFVFVVSAVFAPRPVFAVLVEGGPVTVVETAEPIRLSWSNAIVASAAAGLINAIQLFAQTFAYDLASGLANGFKGQNPFAFLDDPGTYFTSVAFNAAGEFIGSLRGPWEFLGINLCSPRIPDIGLAISLGLAERFQRPTPKCDFARTINNWRSVAREASDPHALLKHLNLAFDPGQTDIGQALKAQEAFRIEIIRQEKAAEQKRDEGGGILPQEGIIAGRVKTPASVINANFETLPEQGAGAQVGAGDVIGATLGSGAVWGAVGTTVLSTFVNTLLARSLRLALEGIFSDSPSDPLPDLLSEIGGTLPPVGEAARRAPGLNPLASTLLATPPRPATGAFEYLSELAACPRNPAVASQFNCTIDAQFMVAIQGASTGKPLTVAQAVEKGYLNRARAFGFTNPGSDPAREPTLSEGYAYSSLKKLRLFRIIPLGWELAAERINANDQTATLGDVLDGWDKEGDIPGCQGTDEQIQSGGESRFCGLVDPNWVLKAPLAQCGAQVFSAILDASGISRQENCADVRHCIADDGSGSCDGWGYCTREKNTWRFNGDACQEQFASCDTFKPDVRGAQAVSLLENTLDFGACTAENAGCTGYLSAQQFGAGDALSWNGSSGRLYLDRDAPECSVAQEGCTEVVLANSEVEDILDDGEGADAVAPDPGSLPDAYPQGAERAYYRLPPEYLGCTGEEGDPAQCGNFARVCREEEVGCESYTPAGGVRGTGEPAISAIATTLDNCPPRCVGYDTYVKLGSRFEPAFTRAYLTDFLDASTLDEVMPALAPEENLYPLIPTGALSCNAQEVGCEEFTNLRTEQREYYADVRACQQPAVDSQTYFTWEGSDTAGYQLKTWSFKRSGAGPVTDYNNDGDDADSDEISAVAVAQPPCTNYSVALSPEGNLQVNCLDTGANQAVCDPQDQTLTEAQRADCRAFYDESGNIFHRYLSRTIVSTDECQAMRWTGLPALPEILPQTDDTVDETVDELKTRLEEGACKAAHGFWNETTRECLYLAAPSLSNSCRVEAYGCRAFKGNTAGNIETAFSEDFEGSATLSERGWTTALTTTMSISAEAINVGGHSLRVSGAVSQNHGVSRTFSEPFASGATYFVRLNIKGTAGTGVRVALGDENLGEIELTPEWRFYELGPLVLRSSSAVELRFRRQVGDTFNVADVFYLDDVSLRRTQDTLYLIKYGWDVPISCDRLPEEAGGGFARGAMLGCRSYNDRAGAGHTLKSFASLCRDVAVGCTEVIDTRNSEALFEEAFNETNSGICRGEPSACRVDTNGNGQVTGADSVVCTVPAGATSCQYGPGIDNADGSATEDNLTVDDWDIDDDARKFIVRADEFACQNAQKGCSALGRPGASGAETVYRRNVPERYGLDLCQQEALGCQAWTRSDRSAAYFKDPEANRCSFRTNVSIGAGSYSGWFRDVKQTLTGTASLRNSKQKCQGYGSWNFSTNTCVATEEFVGGNGVTYAVGATICSQGGTTPDGYLCVASVCARGAGGSWQTTSGGGGTCVTETPCYGEVEVYDAQPGAGTRPAVRVYVSETYLAGGSSFGIWRNADANYGGYAGACPAAEATCTAFVDPTDTSVDNPEGVAYYFKDNARMQLARSECDGQVSRSEGCALFRAVEDPALRYSAAQSYLSSDNNNNAAVSPVSLPSLPGQPTQNDTNTILKVTRDRVCSEWFQCASAQWSWDEQLGRMVSSCRQLGRCNELATSPAVGNTIGTCSGWVREPLLSKRPQTDKVACEQAGFSWNSAQAKCNINDDNDCEDLGGIWHPDPDGDPDVGQSARCSLAQVLTSTYLLRDRTFSGQDYVGYTVPNLYAVDELEEVDIGSGEECTDNDDCSGYGISNHTCGDSGHCTSPRLAHIVAGTTCTPGTGSDECAGNTYCTTSGQCAKAPNDGSFSDTTTDELQCRGFQEGDAPFPNTPEIRKSNAFEKVNKCMDEDSANCVCDYTKASFGGNQLYFAPNSANIASRYCIGVPIDAENDRRPKKCSDDGLDDYPFISEEQCQSDGGVCQQLSSREQVRGWRGYCLDYDPSRNVNASPTQNPCLTWFPVDQLSSQGDLYNQDLEASYTLGQNPDWLGNYYCLLGGETESPVVYNKTITSEEDKVTVNADNVADQNIYQYDIQKIRIVTSVADFSGTVAEENDATSLGPMSRTYEMDFGDENILGTRLNNSAGNSTQNWWARDMNPGGSGVEQIPDTEWWWWAGDDNGNDNTTQHGTGNTTPELRYLPWGMAQSGAATIPGGTQILDENTIYDDVSGFDSSASNIDTGNDAAAITFHFDPETRKLTHIALGFYDEDTSAELINGAVVGGPITITAQVTIFLHPHCEVVAGIDPNLGARGSAPATNRLRGDSNSVTIGIGGVGTSYDRDGEEQHYPYGSSSSTSLPTSAAHPWYLNHNGIILEGEPNELATFSGWPWGCTLLASRDSGECDIWPDSDSDSGIGPSKTAPTNSDPDTPEEAIEQFGTKLFTKSYQVFRWSGNSYVDAPEYAWDLRTQADTFETGAPQVPQFQAPNGSSPVGRPSDNDPSAGDGEPMAINGLYAYGAQVEGVNGFLLANLEWHMWADPQRMPIRTVRLDTGDGSIIAGEGLYKNSKPRSCTGTAFGNTTESCKIDPYRYEHLYSCGGSDDPYWRAGSSCPIIDFEEIYGGCCVFKPKIQAIDNWGFCNGSCGAAGSPGGTECFETTECTATSTGAWSEFAGEVIIAP